MINNRNDIDKNKLVQATNELYRITLLFPKKEPLRYKMRGLADEVLADFVSFPEDTNNIQVQTAILRNFDKKLKILDSFFEIAKPQNWVSPKDVLNLQQEYSKIRETLADFKEERREVKREKEERVRPQVKKETVKIEEKPISERQKRILKALKEKGKMQVWQVKDIFSDVSKRTIRRDFKSLLRHGLVERKGERNNTFYQIKDRTREA